MGGDTVRRRFIEVAYRVFHEGNPPVLSCTVLGRVGRETRLALGLVGIR